jgi:hypothetical protein
MPIPLRADFDAQMVRAAAKRSKDGAQPERVKRDRKSVPAIPARSQLKA